MVGYVFKDKRAAHSTAKRADGKKRDKRAWAAGGGAWSICYEDVDGRLRKERTTSKTRALADRILADRQDAVERARLQGFQTVDQLLDPKPPVTVRLFSKDYLSHVQANLSETSAERDRWTFDKHLLPRFGSMVLDRITPGHVQKYADDRSKAGAAPATVVRELMVLSGLFREARKREILDRNPVSLVKKPKIDNKIVRYLDETEEAHLLARCPEPLYSAVIASIHSGLRESELTRLTWPDVRFEERSIVVRETKSHKDRVVPMSDTLFRLLQSLPRDIRSPHVFTTPAGEPYERFNNTVWRRAIREAGLKGFRWNDLRHTFASRLAQAGVSLQIIKELMGHSDIRVTLRYAHLNQGNLVAAVKALDGVKDGVNTTPMTTPAPVDSRSEAM